MGCVYRQKGTKNYTLKYYRNGRPIVESAHTNNLEATRRLLRQREGEISRGQLPGIYFDKVFFEELSEDFLIDYRINGKKTLIKAERGVRQLKKFFGGMRATEINTSRIREYINKRMEDGLANATINRELAALKRMFNLANECTPPKVSQVPYIPMLKEANVRKGFFEHDEFLALREALPLHLRHILTFAYYSGWRKSEILNLRWENVDLKSRIVRLEPGETKNEEGRTMYLNDELFKIIQGLSSQRFRCPYLFHYRGKRIRDFRGRWARACRQTGLVGRLFHDLRRTAVRNMIRSGIPERVAMMLSGHKTRSVFDRYNIVNEQDLIDAARKQQAYLEQQSAIEGKDFSRGKVIPLAKA